MLSDESRVASRHPSFNGQIKGRKGSDNIQPTPPSANALNVTKSETMDRVDENREMVMINKSTQGDISLPPAQNCMDIGPFASSERVDDPSSTLLYHVLVVDDSLMNRKMLASLLKSVGHTCDQAVDGLKAIEAVRAKQAAGLKYDAILMDFVMPNMEGPTATAEIRAMGIDWPIIGLTGNGMEPDIQTFLKAGANKVFVKPMYIEDFESTMRSLSNPSSSNP